MSGSGNSVPSNEFVDLDVNMSKLDEMVNSKDDYLVNRSSPNGNVTTRTFSGMNSEFDVILNKTEQEALSRSRISAPQEFVNLQFFYTFTGFNASLSSYYIYSDDDSVTTQLLIPDVHYEFTDTTTTTIKLLNSYIGCKIIAKSLDPLGSGVISAGNSFASFADLAQSVGLSDNSVANVAFPYSSEYVITPGVTAESGDIAMNDGRTAILQPTENGYSVTSFGDGRITASHQGMFEAAAARALLEAKKATGLETKGLVFAPIRPEGGSWNLTSEVTTPAMWYLTPGSEQQNPANWNRNNSDNLSYLKGEVFKLNGRGNNQLVLGETDLSWVDALDVSGSILGTAVVQTVSSIGKSCYFAATRTSDNPVATEGSIGYVAYNLNDRTTAPGVTYCYYGEATQKDGAGTTMCMETNVSPNSTPYSIYPNQRIGNATGATFNYLVGGPVNRPSHPGTSPTSCGFLLTGGSAINPATGKHYGFECIMVVGHNSIESSVSREVFRLPTDASIAYYSTLGALRCNAKGDIDPSSNGRYSISVYSSTNVKRSYIATGSDWRPGNDGAQSIGAPVARYLDGYFVNTPTGTSDRNEKQQETKITEVLHEAALAVEPLLWKWNAAVKDKGGKARWHTGPIAQDVQDAFEIRGINPFEYGFIGKDAITKTVPNGSEMQKDSEGKLIEVQLTKEIPTGESIMNIRATELQWLIISAQNARQNKLEERLNALENK